MSGEDSPNSVTDQRAYDEFCLFLSVACGILLGNNKQYLVNSRLNKLMNENGIDSLAELVKRLKQYPESKLYVAVVDAMTTNETSWFRDYYPYDFLAETLLPEMASANKEMRIWSAAASSGQEPYSISIIIDEFQKNKKSFMSPVKIIATDISQTVLSDAREGIFDQMTLNRGMSPSRVNSYFEAHGKMWKLKNEIKQRITFREFNLLGSYATLGKFDVIFCRNVLIYFSTEVKKDILSRIAGALNPRGYLILGGAESMANYSESFDVVRVKNGLVYQLKE